MVDGAVKSRRDRLLADIDVATARGLEVAPLNRATVAKTEGDITYIDRSDYETLLARHKGDPNVHTTPILPVDVAVGYEKLPVALAHLPKFDYIVASHVVEHIPNLVEWFEELRGVLNLGGSVRLAVHHKHFTFDHFRTETVVTEVPDSYVRGNRHPSVHSVIDQMLNSRLVGLSRKFQIGPINDQEVAAAHSRDFRPRL